LVKPINNKRKNGEIGRRAGLRSQSRKRWGFESPFLHHSQNKFQYLSPLKKLGSKKIFSLKEENDLSEKTKKEIDFFRSLSLLKMIPKTLIITFYMF
jgi:hypothetical protein